MIQCSTLYVISFIQLTEVLFIGHTYSKLQVPSEFILPPGITSFKLLQVNMINK